MYWWAIKWKSFAEADLLVSEKQAEYIDKKLDLPASERGEFFKINGEKYSYSDIRRVERTTKRIQSDTKALYSGLADSLNEGPIINEDGDVTTNWYKKLVTAKEYESYYAKAHSYYLISRDGADCWVAIRLVEKVNGDRPDYLELCTKEEAERLWKISSTVPS